jgi:hypothetical protein
MADKKSIPTPSKATPPLAIAKAGAPSRAPQAHTKAQGKRAVSTPSDEQGPGIVFAGHQGRAPGEYLPIDEPAPQHDPRRGHGPKSGPPAVRLRQGPPYAIPEGRDFPVAAPPAAFLKAASVVSRAHKLSRLTDRAFAATRGVLNVVFLAGESINSASLWSDARHVLRRDLERMDEAERKKTIAALMAYIGELQASGALESVPSDRLARVAKLIGEAAEIISKKASKAEVPLFEARERDPVTLKMPTAKEWFDQYWAPRLAAERLYSDDLKRTDLKLYNALAAQQSRDGASIGDLIPIRHKREAHMTEEEIAARRNRINADGAFRSRRSRLSRAPD